MNLTMIIYRKFYQKKFEKQFTYLGESTEKCINFTIPIEKEVTRFDKNEEKITKNIFYR